MEVPEDLFQHDMSTFPTEDPAVTKQREAMEEKLRKAEEAAQRKAEQQRKKEKQVVDKLVETAPPPKKAAGASSPAEEAAKKRVAMKKQKILLYFQHFGAKLSCKAPKTLPDDEHKLDELLATIRNDLGSKGGIQQAGNIYLASVGVLERVNPLGLQLTGPAASLSQTAIRSKEAWNDLVTEVAIDNAEW